LLKQLVYVLQLDNFREGMRYYFKKHSWGNTTLEDFLGALEHSAQIAGVGWLV
jgi:aminopeptidase N